MRDTNKYKPKDITIENGIEIASFAYYDGINFCRQNDIK